MCRKSDQMFPVQIVGFKLHTYGEFPVPLSTTPRGIQQRLQDFVDSNTVCKYSVSYLLVDFRVRVLVLPKSNYKH